MPARSRHADLAQQARFIFKGTVRQTRATTMPAIPPTDKTVVVHVDEVMQAPEALRDYAGQDITVRLSNREKVTRDEQAVFYTNGWLFGAQIAVQSLGHEAVAPAAARRSRSPSEAVASMREQEVETRVASADLVIRGKVTAVRLSEETMPVSAASRTATYQRAPISEHDPLWQEAVIAVDEVHKGSLPAQNVIVRFPESTDVRWYKAPKFRPGQEGIFILHQEQVAPPTAARTPRSPILATAAGAYTALQPADFLPAHDMAEVQAAIRASQVQRP